MPKIIVLEDRDLLEFEGRVYKVAAVTRQKNFKETTPVLIVQCDDYKRWKKKVLIQKRLLKECEEVVKKGILKCQ